MVYFKQNTALMMQPYPDHSHNNFQRQNNIQTEKKPAKPEINNTIRELCAVSARSR